MKRYRSVFSLFVRSSFWKVLAILLLLPAVEFGIFYPMLQKEIKGFSQSVPGGFAPAEKLLTSSGIYWWFAGALILLSIVLWLPGCEFNEKTGYTLRRLSVTEKEVFVMQASCNAAAYLMLFLMQALTGFALCSIYTALAPERLVSNQTIFMAFYRSPFLHALVPLEESSLWVRNGFLILTLGCAGALFPYVQRRKQFPFSPVFLLIVTVLFFANRDTPIGNYMNTFSMIFVCSCLLANSFYTVCGKEEAEDE